MATKTGWAMSPPRLATTGQASTCIRGLSVRPRRRAASLPRSSRIRRKAPTKSAARSFGVRLGSLMGEGCWLLVLGTERELAETEGVSLNLTRRLVWAGLVVGIERGGLNGFPPRAVRKVGSQVGVACQIEEGGKMLLDARPELLAGTIVGERGDLQC